VVDCQGYTGCRSGYAGVVLSHYILDELVQVLPRLKKVHMTAMEIRDLADSLMFQAEMVEPDGNIADFADGRSALLSDGRQGFTGSGRSLSHRDPSRFLGAIWNVKRQKSSFLK